MNSISLHTDLVSVIPNNRESLIEGLRSIAAFDDDFSGYNGTKSEVLAKFDVGLNSDIKNVLHFLKDGELPHTQGMWLPFNSSPDSAIRNCSYDI